MGRRFAHCIARILILLAIVLPTIPAARSADAILRTLAPSSARPGDEILITGDNLLPAGGGTIFSTVRYGRDYSLSEGRPLHSEIRDLASSDWSNTRVRVRLPADIGPGAYWLAVFRDSVLSSNQLGFTVPLIATSRPVVTSDVPIATPPPQIVSAITPVRPGYMIGVFGRDFGERPGQLLLALHLDIGVATYPLTDLDWHSRGIAGRIPRIVGVPDGPASLIVERADGRRSEYSSVRFVATREVRVIPGGEVHMDTCSDEADSNRCGRGSPGGPSFDGEHSSYLVTAAQGERGIDTFSIALANGWRFHELHWLHRSDEDRPSWTIHGRETDHPSFHVVWRNPPGLGPIFSYRFNLYIVGPVGVPYR